MYRLEQPSGKDYYFNTSFYFFCRTICSDVGTSEYGNTGVYFYRIVVNMAYFTTGERLFIVKRVSNSKVKSKTILS
jgi:hypothetical protein